MYPRNPRTERARGAMIEIMQRHWLTLILSGMVLGGFPVAAQEPANPHANEKARAILNYFQSLESRTDRRLVSGQFSNFGAMANLHLLERIHEKTGYWPAIFGADYASGGGLTHTAPNRAAIQYWNAGGLVTLSAHLYNPARTNAGGGGLRDMGVDLKTLLDTNTEAHARWLGEMDQLADGLEELKDAGVVVLWRPFHEMNGGWFWWGAKDPATFIQLWRQMFDYFTKVKSLDNLLWVYAPNHGDKTAAYYPGDAYVDLIGLDAYTDFVDTNHIHGYVDLGRIHKPFGFAEFGPHAASHPPGNYDYRRFLAGVKEQFPRTVFFMSWNDNWSLDSNTHVKEMLSDPWIVNRENLPAGLAGKR